MSKSALLLFALALFGCAPEQPQATDGCETLTDCQINQVCEVPTHTCIDEPENRFLGSFSCTIDDKEKLEPSQVIGHVENDRFSLPTALCSLQGEEDEIFTLLAFGYSAGDILQVRVPVKDLSDGNASIGLFLGTEGVSGASLENFDTYVGSGYSHEGTLTLSARPATGRLVTGYVDVTMYPTMNVRGVDDDAIFGIPCPRGRADCGEKLADVGGADSCFAALDTPMCSRPCDTDGDCSLGSGTCVQGRCTRPCTSSRDCVAPLTCIKGDPGESNGCY